MTNWPWQPKQTPTLTSDGTGRSPGRCELCSDYGTVCLNGQRFLCWDHYYIEKRIAVARGGD